MAIETLQGYCEILYNEKLQEEDFYIGVQLRKCVFAKHKEYIIEIYKLVSMPNPQAIPIKEAFPCKERRNEEAEMIRLTIRAFDEEIKRTRAAHKKSWVRQAACQEVGNENSASWQE